MVTLQLVANWQLHKGSLWVQVILCLCALTLELLRIQRSLKSSGCSPRRAASTLCSDIPLHIPLHMVEGERFKSSDLCELTLKAPEERLLAEIAAEHGCPLLKTDYHRYTASFSLRRSGRRRKGIHLPAWVVAGTYRWRSCSSTSQFESQMSMAQTGRPTRNMAYSHLGKDNFSAKDLTSSLMDCSWRYDACPNL